MCEMSNSPAGASAEGTLNGSFNEMISMNGMATLETPEFYGLFLQNRLAVLYSPWDLLSGVNRESNSYAKGVAPDDAVRLVLNAITYGLSH